jgi:FkbM family methyltransferase
MKTKYKIAIAKTAYHTISAFRRLTGAGDEAIVVRNGIRYCLDLSEGIDLAIYLQGQFEPSTAAACARNVKSGQRILDIGANIGAHTLNLARLVGESGAVLAFEPTQYAFGKLQRNLSLNPELSGRVTARQCFLGPSDHAAAPVSIYSSWPLSGGENLHGEHLGASMSTAGVVTRSVDEVLGEQGNPAIDFVKLDVDGYECDVLEGARGMMARNKPIFVMELAPYVLHERGASLQKLLSYFIPLGYRIHREDNDAPLPADADRLASLIGGGASWNVIARA